MTNNHLLGPSFDAPNHHSTPTTTTTMWQCHVTSAQAHAVLMASGRDGDGAMHRHHPH